METSEPGKKFTVCNQTLTNCLIPTYVQIQKLYFCFSLYLSQKSTFS